MNRRSFLTSIAVTVATLVAGLKQARGGHVGGYVTEVAAIAPEGFILPPNVVDGAWWEDNFGKLYSETGDLSAVRECECGVTYYVGPDGDDARDGLAWKTRKSTCAGLLHSGSRIILGPSRPYPQRIIADDPDSAVLVELGGQG